MIPIPYNQIKRAIDAAFLEKWQKQWNALPGLVHSKLMLGDRIDETIGNILVKWSREDLQLLAQIMTGHCLLGRHLSHWKAISCMCRPCDGQNGSQESPYHLTEECEALTLERMYHEEELLRGNLKEAMLIRFFKEPRVVKLLYRDEEAEEE